ncbi:death-associated protein kinase related [Haematobia irritans]|uniref:death-associated protein kinase related n=1 Tax=Haematobia irritans TaxID=7368 RepID=UPI003F50A4DD
MFAEGIFPIGDGLLDIDEERLKGLLVPEDINEIYDVEQTPFARGKFAAVRRAIHKNSGVHFAAKFLKRRRRAQSSDKEIKHEIAVLMLCNEADNIVKLNAVHESRSDTALLLELATGGELQTFLDNEECLNEGQARICMREVLKALQFLHKRSIVHLDLKPQNILLRGERVEEGLKLCDFGISRVVTEGTNVREIVGTPDYVAPEVLQYEPLSLSTDIWSVGVLTYVLLSGFSPFGGDTKQETFLNISQCALTFPDKLFGGVSSAAIDFIRKALRIKPSDRMTAAGCLEHIWLKDECSIDRHIFNSQLSNKQQLDHDVGPEDVEEDEDEDDSDDHAGAVDEDIDVGNVVIAEQESVEMNHQEHTNNIADDDDDEVVNATKPEAISVDNSEEEDDLLTSSESYNNKHGKTNGHSNGYTTTSNHHMNGGHTKTHSNGHVNGHINGGFTKSPTSSTKNNHHHHTTKTTVVHNVPATKAITIPLGSVQTSKKSQEHFPKTTTTQPPPPTTPTQLGTMTSTPHELQLQQQQQKQQFLHIPARRQSSESNKENTFLTTKKIAPTPGMKKPHLTVSQSNTTTATILINPSMGNNINPNNIVATITLPTMAAMVCTNSSSSSSTTNPSSLSSNEKLINIMPSLHTATNTSTTMSSTTNPASSGASSISTITSTNINNNTSFFPDAPTTPKVIRKAPNSDTSPTSVKALVKKFQLEGGEQPLSPPEFATNGSKQQQQHHQVSLVQHHQQSPLKVANETKTKFLNGGSGGGSSKSPPLTHSTAITISNNNTSSRRASEPITAIHHNKKLGMTSSSAPVSIPPLASNSFKTMCVYCNSCSSSNNMANNGCRHPSSNATTTTTVHVATNKNGGTTTTTSCNSGANFSQSTKSLINGSSSNGSLTSSASSNGTTMTTSSSNAMLFTGSNQQQQQQHHLLNSHHHSHHHHAHHHHHHHPHSHHLHHHGVVKNSGAAANGLSLDQGIIC